MVRVAPLLALLSFAWSCAGCHAGEGVAVLDEPLAASAAAPSPIVYWHEARTAPRALQIHVLRVDLRAPQFEVVVAIAEDPDGEGGAEAKLEKPLPLATRFHAIAAVNANAFDQFPRPASGQPRQWVDQAPALIEGWAKNGERLASPPEVAFTSFWVDPDRRGHIGKLAEPKEAAEAVAGFGPLVIEGELVDTAMQSIHPRSAIGLDRDGWTLWMVVVDGRQPGYSEGLATGELAELMKQFGCWNAMNLDGGGSSTMLLAKESGTLSIMNRPSGTGTRPIPVMLAVREVALRAN